MNEQEWNRIVEALRDAGDWKRAAAAAGDLHEMATIEYLPRLMKLLVDQDILVREAAAWPVTELAGPAALPDLLAALQRGFDAGYDHDGFQTALIDMALTSRTQTRDVLTRLESSSDSAMRDNARWLLEYCADEPDA
jgi:HEAT repeat protein